MPLTDLEIKITYTEVVDELNRTVYRQQQQIDRLIEQSKIPTRSVQNMNPKKEKPRIELPPHY